MKNNTRTPITAIQGETIIILVYDKKTGNFMNDKDPYSFFVFMSLFSGWN